MKRRRISKETRERMIYKANEVIKLASEIIGELACSSPVSDYFNVAPIGYACAELRGMLRESLEYCEKNDVR